MDLKAKPQSQKAVGSRSTKDYMANNPSLHRSHYPRPHGNHNRERNGKAIHPDSTAVRNRGPIGVAADIQLAKTRTRVLRALEPMPRPRPTASKPDNQAAVAKVREQDDVDDVFGVGVDPYSKLDAKISRKESGVGSRNHRAHATAIITPHRRIRARDNLSDVFEKMRPQKRLPSTQPGADVSMSRAAFEYYLGFVLSSARVREALVGFGKRENEESSDDGSEDRRVRADELMSFIDW